MGGLLTRRAVVAARIEAVEGVTETLAAADANFLVMKDAKCTPEIPLFKRDNTTASLSAYSLTPGALKGTMVFKVENKGSGTAGTAPAVAKLLKACGWGETIAAGVSATYAPISTAIPSLTIELYKDGIKKQLRGARGTWKYSAKVGEPGIWEFTFTGVWNGAFDAALLTGTGIEMTLPPTLLSASFTVQGFAALISQLSVDCGNTLAMLDDINKADGHVSARVTARAMKGALDPMEELVATNDWYGKWKSGALGILTFVQNGGAGNICTFTAPKCQYSKIAEADKGGLAALNLDYELVRSSAGGDDELSIVYT